MNPILKWIKMISKKLSGTVKVELERNILNKFVKEVHKPLAEAIKHRDKLTAEDFQLIASICDKESKRLGKIVDKKVNPSDHTNIDLGLKYD